MEMRRRRFRRVNACRRGEKRPLPLWVWLKGVDEAIDAPPAPGGTTPLRKSPQRGYIGALTQAGEHPRGRAPNVQGYGSKNPSGPAGPPLSRAPSGARRRGHRLRR